MRIAARRTGQFSGTCFAEKTETLELGGRLLSSENKFLTITTKLEPRSWMPFFDQFSKDIKGKRPSFVCLEVMEPTLLPHNDDTWLPLQGISFDPKANHLSILTEALDHRISDPQAIFVQKTKDGPKTTKILAIEILDKDNRRQVVRLRTETPTA